MGNIMEDNGLVPEVIETYQEVKLIEQEAASWKLWNMFINKCTS
jgi:hypothetical protein